jgi:hypothetical protein
MLVSGKQLVILTRSIPVHTRALGDFSDSESIFRVRTIPAAAARVRTAAQVLPGTLRCGWISAASTFN